MRELDGKLANVQMPTGADKPKTMEIDATGPTTILAVTTVDKSGVADAWELYRKANLVADELEVVQGVKEVKIMNPLTPQITIIFDEVKLAQTGIQRAQVEGILKTAQLEMPLGSFYDAENDKNSIGIKKSLTDISQLEDLLIAPSIQLKDVARVSVELNNNDYYNRLGHRENDEEKVVSEAGDFRLDRAIFLSISSGSGEDLIGLGKRLTSKYEELVDRSDLAPDLRLTKVYDMADFTADQLKEIEKSIVGGPIEALGSWGVIGYLFGGLTLVVLFLLIFVNWRVALMAGLSIPLAIGMTTTYLKLTGVSINTIVLFSMILVVGLVVDPTIVFLEAMQRYREQGYSGKEAMVKTFNSVGVGVLLSAVANFMVFVPFGVVSGFFGQIIQYIPQTVIPAIVASFIVPTLFFIPVASGWLKAHKQNGNTDNPELVGVWSLSRALGRGIMGLLGKGKIFLRVFIILVAVVAPIAVGFLFIGSEKIRVVQFANPKDSEMLTISGSVSDRWSFNKAIGVIGTVQGYLGKQAEVRKFAVYSQTGNSFVLFVDLFPIVERQKEDLRTAEEFVNDTNEYLATISNATVEAAMESSGPPQDSYPVRIRLFDSDLNKLQKASSDVTAFLEKQKGVVKVEDSLNVDGKNSGTLLVLDSNNPLNINPFVLAGIIKNQLDETEVVSMQLGGDTYKVVTRFDQNVSSVEDIKKLPIAMGVAKTLVVPTVGDLVYGTEEQKAQSLARLNGKRYVEISAKVDKDTDPIKVQRELTKYLSKDKLASLGLSNSSATETKGVTGAVAKSFTELFLALIIALFLIYLILVGFFRSLLSPIIILFAVPLGFIGVFPAVAIATGQLGFLELLGVVAMAGIVVNVTILIIDFANQMRAKGMSAQEAISTSIAVRFKPILLTKMTIFAGLMPLALFSPFWRGLATVIVFGIIVSGFLSFVTTPILYVWFDAIGNRFKRKPIAQVPVMADLPASAGLWGQKPVDEVVWQIAPDQGIDE
jgi:HAE1 family hydrophobic/amphiphilic exporter-1